VLSEVAGRRIFEIRRAIGLTRGDVAAQCTALGLRLSADQVANIETGRPDHGVRTRDITLDELATLARVLGVSPVDLAFDVGRAETTAVAGAEVDTFAASEWWSGNRLSPGIETPDDEDRRRWAYGGQGRSLYRFHDVVLAKLDAGKRRLDSGRGDREALTARQEANVRNLARLRDRLRLARFTLPPLPEWLLGVVDPVRQARVDLDDDELDELDELLPDVFPREAPGA